MLDSLFSYRFLDYIFTHSFFGLCAWDLPALIVLIAMITVFAVHRHNMNKREKDFEKELADRLENGTVSTAAASNAEGKAKLKMVR